MSQIFLSYRRQDHKAFTNRIYDRLVGALGKGHIFKDIDNIPPGKDFRGVLREATAACRVMLVVIGPNWLTITDAQGKRRLDDPNDFVRLEVESGLQRDGVLVIPLLIDGATMPNAHDLPDPLKPLAYNNAFFIRDDPDFHRDMDRLILYLRPYLRRNFPWRGLVAGAALLLLVLGALLLLPRLLDPRGAGGDDPTREQIPTTVVAAQPSITPTQVGETTEPTLDDVAIIATTRAWNAALIATASSPTPSATPSPTVDRQGTLDAAATGTEQYFIGQTLEATLLTPLPSETPTLTPDPLEAALLLGQNFTGTRNADWTPISYTFEDGVEMVLVPKGCFTIGTNPQFDDERNGNEVCFDTPFWMDKYEVTNGQFGSSGNWSGDDLPRETVNWFDAKAHCESRGARLPTEAEWEYAARGPEALIFPWGSEFVGENVVYSANSGSQTAFVGSREGGVSWVGAYDLSGNVWEWVSSLYQPYPYDSSDGREDIANRTDARVLRGGSWNDASNGLRAANRLRNAPDNENYYIGFRCARSR